MDGNRQKSTRMIAATGSDAWELIGNFRKAAAKCVPDHQKE